MMKIQDETERRTLSVRLPQNVATWLEAEAVRNDRSLSSEVVQILRAHCPGEPKRVAG
jgi:Arc-like DNA binding domain